MNRVTAGLRIVTSPAIRDLAGKDNNDPAISNIARADAEFDQNVAHAGASQA